MEKKKRHTVITGASSGIGYEAAKIFAARGKHLIITARRRERLEKLKMEIGEEFPQIEVIVNATDLSVLENVYQFYKDFLRVKSFQ